jgi:hypothetical protein
LTSDLQGAFDGSVVLPAPDGKPTITCQELADQLDVENLDQGSDECFGGTIVAAFVCCGDEGLKEAVPCVEEVVHVSQCFALQDGCETCALGNVPDATTFCVVQSTDVQDFHDCCPACANEISILGNCITLGCGGYADQVKELVGSSGHMSSSSSSSSTTTTSSTATGSAARNRNVVFLSLTGVMLATLLEPLLLG